MRLKLDENLSQSLAAHLRSLGHDVCTAADEGLLSQPDKRIARACIEESRVLLTLDLDFANEPRSPPGRRPAFVVFRPHVFDLATIRHIVVGFVQSPESQDNDGATVIVEPHRTRFRHPEPWDDPRYGPADAWEEFPRNPNPPKDLQ